MTITRRTALGATSALILAPAPALASPDPILAAYAAWKRAAEINSAALERVDSLGVFTPEYNAADASRVANEGAAEWACKLALVKMIATTPAGIAAQLQFGRESYILDCAPWEDDLGEHLLNSLHRGATGLA